MKTLQTPEVPKLKFTYAGVARTLNKNTKVQQAVRRCEMSLAEARREPWFLRFKFDGREHAFRLAASDKEALRLAKDKLDGAQKHPVEFAHFLAAQSNKNVPQIPLSQLVAAYRLAPVDASIKTREKNIHALNNLLGRAGVHECDAFHQILVPATVAGFFSAVTGQSFENQRLETTARRTANSLWQQAASVFAPRALAFYKTRGLYHPCLDEFLAAGVLHRFTRLPKVEYNPPSDKIIASTLAAWESTDDPQLFLAVGLELAFGLRADEMANIRTGFFKQRHGYPVLDGELPVKNKTGLIQVRALDPFYTTFLFKARARGWLDLATDGFVIAGSDTFRDDGIERVVSGFLRAQGWQTQKTNHALRAYAGCQVAMKYGIYEAQTWLRHSSVKVTENNYSHFIRKFKPQTLDEIPARWAVSDTVPEIHVLQQPA